MKAELRRFGVSQSPVLILDDLSEEVGDVRSTAAALAPFPSLEGSYYPGLRRVITKADAAAYAYVERTLEAAAPYIGGGFDTDLFDLIEASFSMVTAPPETLVPAQRAPHFDSVDPKYLAVLHYLSDVPGTGTAFYRQRATGIETVTEANVDLFVATARSQRPPLAYVGGSNADYEEIGRIDGVPGRLIVYQGRLLHSGIIPSGMPFSTDPRNGRLTANIFIRAH